MNLMKWCLSAALFTACAVSLAQTPGHITVNYETSVDVPYALMFQTNQDGGWGVSWPYSYSGSGTVENPFDQGQYANTVSLLGLYQPEDSELVPGLNVMVSRAFGESAVGRDWSEVFTGPSEQSIIDAMMVVQSGAEPDSSLDLMNEWWLGNQDAFAHNGEDGVFLNFSKGQIVGTGTWSQNAVPEPATLVLLGAGGSVLALRRRLRRA